MTRKYGRGELRHLLSGLQRHPEDNRIVYTPEDRELVIPLIREGVIDAAIIPALDSPATSVRSAQAQEYGGDYDNGELAQQFFVRDDNLYFYVDGNRVSMSKGQDFPEYVQESFTRLSAFIYPHETWTPAKPVRQLANQISDLLWNYRHDDEKERRIVELAEWLDHKYPRRQTNLLVLWQEAGTGQRGPMPNFHFDMGLTAHISGHTPMQYIVGRLTKDQWDILNKNRVAETDKLLDAYPELQGRIRNLDPGDMAVFGRNFVHRSSPEVSEKGQLNIAAEPSGGWPYDL
jgi:hypothetical protein